MRRNLILTDGGAGDLICQLVAVNYLLTNEKKVDFEIWVPDYLHKFAMHVLQYSKVFPFSKATKKFDSKIKGRTTQWFEHGHTPMRTHPVDYGFHMLADRHIYDESKKQYLKIRPDQIDISTFHLPEKYITIQSTFAEPVKSMSQHVMNIVVDYTVCSGYTPVFLGKEESNTGFKDMKVKGHRYVKYDASQGIDLVNKTDLLQSAAIIAGAAVHIGMDSGLTHLAGCTDTPIIVGYTLVDPEHVAPIRHGRTYIIEPPKDVPNRYFQTRNTFYDGDYRTFLGWETVRDSLKASDFIQYLSYILS